MGLYMGLRSRASNWGASAYSLYRSPRDIRYVPQWVKTRGHPKSHEGPLDAGLPFIPFSLQEFLDDRLTGHMSAFEWGSGGSTLWLAERVGSLISVEHDEEWVRRVQSSLHASKLENCQLRLLPPNPEATPSLIYNSALIEANFTAYVAAVDQCEDRSLDLVLIDGRARADCLLRAASKVKPGGMLILDDSDRERYQEAQAKLGDWERKAFWGIKPFYARPCASTLWTRPLM